MSGGGAAFLGLATRLADAAGPILRRYFRATNSVEYKGDRSPVSEADRGAERAMRDILGAEVPDHGIFGEEFGRERMEAEYVWVLDPLDGTASFVTGKPLFGTLIALTRAGRPVLGVLDQPYLGERWIGVEGRPTLYNGKPVRTRACAAIGDAWLYSTTPQMFEGEAAAPYERLRRQCRRAVFGAECYAYGLLAMGHVDLVVEAELKPYDYCALVPIVEGAGGAMRDWRGEPLTIRSGDRVVAAGDPSLLAPALKLLAT